jgi:GT2 family glycosyltransferase
VALISPFCYRTNSNSVAQHMYHTHLALSINRAIISKAYINSVDSFRKIYYTVVEFIIEQVCFAANFIFILKKMDPYIPENKVMVNRPKVSVAILNFNGFEHTSECLSSLKKSTYQPLSITVIDNASTDDSVRKLKQTFKDENLIELSVNGGYSYGNNIALKRAFMNGAHYVFIINNDITMNENCIEALVTAASNDETIGIIGPKVMVYSKPDTIDNAGILGSIPKASYKWIGMGEKDTGQYEKLVDILYQDGCALMLSKACYEKIGGFDEWLWTYSEESDLCVRARLAGFRVCCLQKAKIWHKGAATLGRNSQRKPHAVYYIIRNNYLFHRRYAGSWVKKMLAISMLLSKTPRYLLSILLKGRESRIKNVWMLLAATFVGITTHVHSPSDIFAPIKTVKPSVSPDNLKKEDEV